MDIIKNSNVNIHLNNIIEKNKKRMKLLIYLGPKGYNIIMEDGTPMEFTDKSQTQDIVDADGNPDMKEAISQCIRHEYEFEII